MNITFVLPGYSSVPIGGYKVVYSYANYLAEQGHRVSVLQSFLPRGGTDTRRGLRSFAVAVRDNWHRGRRPAWFELSPDVRVINMPSVRPSQIPTSDAIVATSVETAPVVHGAARLQGASGFMLIQHYEEWDSSSEFVDSAWRLPLQKLVIAPWLQRRASGMGLETTLVPNAIDPSEFPQGPDTRFRGTEVVALVSEHAWKRTDLVIDVFRRLASEHPGIVLSTFGACARPSGLPDSVTHHESPAPDTLRRLYQDSKIYLCASDAEGWHLPPAEAMSSGCAVVSTDIDGVRAYADGVAVFAPTGDGAGLGDAVIELLGDEDRCAELGLSGARRMREYGPAEAGALLESVLAQREPTK